MKTRDAEKLFELPHRRRHVHDYYAAVHSVESKSDKRAEDYLLWLFGFMMKPGDVLCAYVLRDGAKPKKKVRKSNK